MSTNNSAIIWARACYATVLIDCIVSLIPAMKSKKDQNSVDQNRCPTGVEGRKVAESMNIHHSDLTDWGLSKVRIEPGFTILGLGVKI